MKNIHVYVTDWAAGKGEVGSSFTLASLLEWNELILLEAEKHLR